jgi:hypothetical protein
LQLPSIRPLARQLIREQMAMHEVPVSP